MKKVGEDVWIAKSAKVFPSAYIHGPAIIGKEARYATVPLSGAMHRGRGRCGRKFYGA